MAENDSFADFMQRVRAGDGQAAADLVRTYESAIRMEVRMRLSDPRLQRVFDSMDVCQSVLASFFVRAASGQYEVQEPRDLLKLLVVMARNKVAFQARKQRAQRRDVRRVEQYDGAELQVAGGAPSPSRVIAGQELLEKFREHLSDEERQIAELRAQGHKWEEIATELGGTAQARRHQLARATDRVLRELGVDEAD
jgi:RNA polymerase sigma-70 factor (ECF subfamily)